nr:acyltransferase [Photobacterium leiognathi]
MIRIKRVIFFLFAKFSGAKISKKAYFNNFTKLNSKTIISENCHFNGLRVLGQGSVIIEENFHSGAGCEIITDVHNYNGVALPYDDTYIVKNVHIEKNVWLGRHVIILGGVTIGEGAIIQAGSVVTKSIPKLAIAGGHPACVFSYRDNKHYKELS